jgi:potassium/hydrogen antiporter
MDDAIPFGAVVLAVSGALLLAVLSSRLSMRIRVPAPAIFLVAAAVASDALPGLGKLPLVTDERIVTVALALILFDGGLQIGYARFRAAAGPILGLGIVSTFLTAALLTLLGHFVLGLGVRESLVLATALAPTDPAVVFSVLGGREITGRSGTILQGESGANDPVGIALMVAVLGSTAAGWHAIGSGAGTFVLQLAVGSVIGLGGGVVLRAFMRAVPLPNDALYPLRTVASALVIYGATAALHGSGFLAVLLAGIVIGDSRAPYKREIERFSSAMGTLAEIVAFTVLGLTVDLGDVLTSDQLWLGLVVAAVLTLVVRPLAVLPLLVPVDLRAGEKAFVVLAGLKGAVPILLGLFALGEPSVPHADRVYGIVFVVVLVSVAVQGGLVPTLADRLGVPMRSVELEPWALGMRFRSEPHGLHRFFVAPGSPADGSTILDLDLGEDLWVSMVSRQGHLVHVSGTTALQAGDEVLLIGDSADRCQQVFGPAG